MGGKRDRREKMASKREEIKAKLLAEAERAIDEMLGDRQFREDMTLSEIEALVGEAEAKFSQAVTQELIREHPEPKSGFCPECGGKLRYKGKRRKPLVTVRGEIEVERAYYVCQGCGAGYFPPG
jgi:YgiT-type zinc finger domain-containing protein